VIVVDGLYFVEYYSTKLKSPNLFNAIYKQYPSKEPFMSNRSILYSIAHAAPKPWAAAASLCTLLLLACGGGGGAGTDSGNEQTPSSPNLVASTSGELLTYTKEKIKQSAAQPSVNETTGGPVPIASPAPAPSAVGSSSNPVFAGTQLQEKGVDEDDLVKTDGSMLYALKQAANTVVNGSFSVTPGQLQAQRRLSDGQLQAAGSLQLDTQIQHSGIYLASAAQRIALLGQRQSVSRIPGPLETTMLPIAPYPYYRTQISLETVALNTTNTLIMDKRVRIDGALVGSRMIGNQLYVVSTWTPNLNKYIQALRSNPQDANAQLAGLSTAEILPTIQIDDQPPEPLLADTDCYLQAANAVAFVQVTTVTAFDLSSPKLQRSSRCFMGGSEGLYMSPSNVYLASSRYYSYAIGGAAPSIFRTDSTTDIHKFALQGPQISYKGSGEVPGHLGWDKDKLSYRMSEYQGDLRVLSFTGQTGWWLAPAPQVTTGPSVAPTPITTAPASPATLTVLREGANFKLQTVGSLPNSKNPAPLGHPGEQIYGVQYVGPRAYLVTFRRIDPLYVLDISNPAEPKTLGELAMPGFSDYLYPMGDKLLLGVGKDASDTGRVGGVKVALMNVADPSKPSVLNSIVIGKGGSASGLDGGAHGINILEQAGVFRIALPVRVHETPSNFTGFYQPSSQGLYRFEVDTAASTLVSKPTVPSVTFPANDPYTLAYSTYFVGRERSVQINSNVYYFTGGNFLTASW
jgi:Beta propeller domain